MGAPKGKTTSQEWLWEWVIELALEFESLWIWHVVILFIFALGVWFTALCRPASIPLAALNQAATTGSQVPNIMAAENRVGGVA